MARVLLSPLNWGMGHCTRLMPFVKHLIARGHEVGIACKNGSQAVLRREFPGAEYYPLPEYPVPYTRRGFSYNKLLGVLPKTFYVMKKERKIVRRLVAEKKFDLIISDNRFGFYHEAIPSFFISHQLRFHVPYNLKRVERFTERFNSRRHQNFERVIIPDNPPGDNALSGKLGQALGSSRAKAYYAGILCSVRRYILREDIDYLVIISGPEAQKRRFRKKVLQQIGALDGRKVVVLGDPHRRAIHRPSSDLVVLSYANREQMARLLARSRFIITRGGYTTVMEMAELGKNRGLFIPTPHQPEQEYLAHYYERKGWFHSVKQSRMNLEQDVKRARSYAGFPCMPRSEANLRRLYAEVFKAHLE